MEDNLKKVLIQDINDDILRLTLDDSKNKNALSEIMMKELINAFTDASHDSSIKVIVIAATGNVFCSGHNLKEINEAKKAEDKGESYYLDLFKTCSELMQFIINCPKPVIAEVNGVATAAGCQLVASCDLAISSNSSKIKVLMLKSKYNYFYFLKNKKQKILKKAKRRVSLFQLQP